MNKKFAWFLGFLTSDGSIVCPTYRKKGDERHICFTLKNTDIEVLYKLKSVVGSKARVEEYPNYKSPQAKIRMYDRKDIIEEYANIKSVVPNVEGYERHFIRGLIDGDGCLHYRQNRDSIRINFINQERDIVEWVIQTLVSQIKIPHKEPKWKHQDNLWIVEWEGKIARLIAWYIYHGDIEECVLKRKHDYYKRHVVRENTQDEIEELYQAVKITQKENHLCMNVNHNISLQWCHSIQSVLPFVSQPIPVNKGQSKYYELYLPYD